MKSDSKDIFNVTKNLHQINTETLIIKHHNITANQHIRMMSEGSCDTEEWNKDYSKYL